MISQTRPHAKTKAYEVGVYYFPGYHDEPLVSRWHGLKWSEWKLLAAAKPRFHGHQQPKVPLWGELDEALPAVMKKKTDVAATYGINHFIFDWYYYASGPFLNRPLDEGYLGMRSAPKVKFALMWANHDWLNIQPARLDGNNPVMLSGAVNRRQFDVIADHLIERYFSSPHYWLVEGKPYFSFYDLPLLLQGLGGVRETARALESFRRKAERAGLKGLHLNLVHWQNKIVGSDGDVSDPVKTIQSLGFDGLASYVWIHHFPEKLHTFPATTFRKVRDVNVKYWQETSRKFSIPYFPNVSMGWDASPRCIQTDAFENRAYPFMSTIRDNTPANFRRALELAKRHVDSHALPTPHLSINSWNEWTEGSYLEPDQVNKYAYLEAVRDVFGS